MWKHDPLPAKGYPSLEKGARYFSLKKGGMGLAVCSPCGVHGHRSTVTGPTVTGPTNRE